MDARANVNPDLLSSSQASEDGAEYLRRIKEQNSGTSLPDSASVLAAVPAQSAVYSGEDRRRTPRFRCSGSAEFRVEGSDVRMWGTLCDVSLHGCYVEMNNTFPVGTRVSLVLEAMEIRTQMQAVVRVSYPFLGMGLCFLKIDPRQLMQLERLLVALSGEASASHPASSQAANTVSTHSLADVDSQAMLDGLTEFFRSNDLLSRDQFYEIARRSRR